MKKINPEILRWARETAGLTLEDASSKLGIRTAGGQSPEERLNSLEMGETEPSRSILVRMAKQYRRPLIVFYMEKPPPKGNRGQDFRSLPNTYTQETNAKIDALIRDILVRQSMLRAALEDEDETSPLKFINSIHFKYGIDKAVVSIKDYIGFDLETFRAQSSIDDAFKYLRTLVEKAGVFVLLLGDLGSHHTAFETDVFRGFALSDDIAPFIVINDRDSVAAWSFTLIHELVHVGLGHTGISSINPTLKIEQFCNQVASEFLLPRVDLFSLHIDSQDDFNVKQDRISEFADSRNLSSSMVAYKLFLMEIIDKNTWEQLNHDYRKMWLDAKRKKRELDRKKKGGPSYYVIRRHRLGDNLISLVHQMVIGGSLTTVKASKILGISPHNLQNLVEPTFHQKSEINLR